MLSQAEVRAWYRVVTNNPHYFTRYHRIGWHCAACKLFGVIEHKSSEWEGVLPLDTQEEEMRIRRVIATEAFEQAAADHASVSKECDQQHGDKFVEPCLSSVEPPIEPQPW